MRKKIFSNETALEYIFNWIFAGGEIGMPHDVNKKFLSWIREEVDEEGVDMILQNMYRYDFRRFESARNYINEHKEEGIDEEETA